jgi:methyl acetate hydrolase
MVKITSVAALRLVEQGKLSLEAPVPNIDPAIAEPQVLDGFDPAGKPLLRPAKRPISLSDLLTHTAGFVYRLWDGEALKYYKALDKLPSAERSKLPHTPLMFDPGERWQYGGNIDWVGRNVQAVSGEPLDAHFRKHIFEPLGMNDTGFVISPAQWAREASGHRRQPDGSLKAQPNEHQPKSPPAPQFFSGGGGIYSSAPDYLTLTRMLMHAGALNGVRILHPDTVALMGQNQIGLTDVGVLRTTAPAVSNDVDFFPGIKLKWGFGHMITTQPVPEGRSASSLPGPAFTTRTIGSIQRSASPRCS